MNRHVESVPRKIGKFSQVMAVNSGGGSLADWAASRIQIAGNMDRHHRIFHHKLFALECVAARQKGMFLHRGPQSTLENAVLSTLIKK